MSGEAAGGGAPRGDAPGGEAPGGERRVLYRCRTPTDWLCPCGAVARRLRKLGLPHETRRVAVRRRDRAEIEELTRQRFVPVLVDGDEVVSDSRRILQWLEHAHGEEGGAHGETEGARGETAD